LASGGGHRASGKRQDEDGAPGARSFDIFGISLIDTRPQPLEAFLWMIEHLIQAKGVNQESTVVAYDDIAGMRSARLFWFLEFFGHDDVHLLNGGFKEKIRGAKRSRPRR
jgi:thiosulfate/3-mercaptopyruvate sulfurtransferase